MVLDEHDTEGLDEDVEDTIGERDVDVPKRDDRLDEPEYERAHERNHRDFAHGHARSVNLALRPKLPVAGDATQAPRTTVENAVDRISR